MTHPITSHLPSLWGRGRGRGRRSSFLFSLLLSTTLQAQQADYAFRDTTLNDDRRIDLVISQLTLDEKIGLLSTNLGVERLGIPDCGHFEGLHGLTLGGPASWGGKERTEDGRMVPTDRPTTIFPQSYGLGSTWDPELLRRVGDQTAEEARYYTQNEAERYHALVMRAPNADLARDPRWGRTEESFGEDPYLTARLTVAHIQGQQGEHPRYWKTAALMKHFLANSNEDGRDSTSSDFDTRLFHEYYSYPFRKGITEGGSRAFMAAYNSWNGTPMTVHPCLEEITRRQWGHNGIICTDGGGYQLLVNAHHAFPTLAEAAAAVVKSGVGQFLDRYVPYVQEALEKGLLTEADIDRAIRGNLYVALKLGLLDGPQSGNPYRSIGRDTTVTPPFLLPETRRLVREVTARSVVLLKNDPVRNASETLGEGGEGGEATAPLLPIDLRKVRKIALIGPYADHIVQDWYSGTPPYEVTILQGLRQAVQADGVEILYAPDNRMGEAEKLAREADLAIVCTGNHPYGTRTDWKFCPVPSDGREAVDRKSLQLPDEDLVKQVWKANPNTVLVLVSSFPYAINWSQEHLPAILHITHCSQEQGNGLADVLLGRVNPAGRTVQTWVRDITDLPPMMDYDIRHGRTYMYHRGPVLYPFGHGLSYTTFEYRKIKSVRQDDSHIHVTVSLRNSGQRDGEEVVQLYVTYPDSRVERPRKQLCAFRRQFVKAGETADVLLTIDKDDLRYWDEAQQAFVSEKGKIEIEVGSSSEDIRGKVISPSLSF